MKHKGAVVICVISLILKIAVTLQTRRPCRSQNGHHGIVCVNDETYCDSIEMPSPQNEEYILATSSSAGDRFYYEKENLCEHYLSKKFTLEAKNILEIDSTKTFQTIQGFGGCWSGGVTKIINELSENLKKCLYESYFSSDGMGYTHIRLPIGSNGFDTLPWAYNENPENDTLLTNFTKLDDRDLMRNGQFRELARITNNQDIKFNAAVWSGPRWMKQNNQWIGLINSQIKPKYYQTFADYYEKWIELMYNDGINIYSISSGNSPWFSLLNSVPVGTGWIASYQATWIAEYLGPTLRASRNAASVEIHGFDDNRFSVLWWLQEMSRSNKQALDYLSSIDFHDYNDPSITPDILDEVQNQFPSKQIWYSEMNSDLGMDSGPHLGSWPRAEDFIHRIMTNLKHSTVGCIDKNLILDYLGGPALANHADAPIILSADQQKFYKQPSFYVKAHFSKFIPPGSVRIDVKLSGLESSMILTLGFLLPSKRISVFLYNNSTHTIEITVKDQLKATFNINLKPKSLNTLIYNVDSSFGYPIPNCLHFFDPVSVVSMWTLKNVLNYIQHA